MGSIYRAIDPELGRQVAIKLLKPSAEALEDAVFDLRNEVRQLRSENERLRQGRPATAAAVAPSFQDAARDAAELIRLRAELDGLRAEMLRALAHEATLQEQFRHALAEAGALGLRLSEAESRRLRLEAENRRLSHANHALRLDLAEAQALAPAANAVAVANLPTERNKGRKAAVSGKGRGQYALF